jgi:hypothetical protein
MIGTSLEVALAMTAPYHSLANNGQSPQYFCFDGDGETNVISMRGGGASRLLAAACKGFGATVRKGTRYPLPNGGKMATSRAEGPVIHAQTVIRR